MNTTRKDKKQKIGSDASVRPWLFVSIAITLFLVAFLIWHLAYSYNLLTSFKNKEFVIERSSWHLLLNAESMKMCALISASTGDLQWKKKYDKTRAEVQDLIREIPKLTQSSEVSRLTDAIKGHLEVTNSIEEEAFTLVSKGKKEEAFDLLSGWRYTKNQRNFSRKSRELVNLIQKRLDRKTSFETTQTALLIVFSCLAVLAFSWTIALKHWRNQARNKEASDQARRQSESYYRAIFETSGSAMFILEEENTILHVNSNFEKLLGYSRTEVEKKKSWTDLIHPDDVACITENGCLTRLGYQSTPCHYEFRFFTGNGELIYGHVTIDLIPDTTQRVVSLIDITERKQAEKNLEYRLDFEERICAASNRFINCAPEEFDDRIHNTLASIGKFVNADRTYIFRFHDDMRGMSNTHEWCAEGVSSQIDELQNLSTASLFWWTEKLKKFETIHLRHLDELPDEANKTREVLEAQHIKSLIVVPLVIENNLLGFIGFDSIHEATEWSSDTISLLQTTGEILTNALQRHQIQQALKQANEELKQRQQQLVEQERQRALTTMVSGIAHDFNNALSPIQGFSQILLDNPKMLDDREKTLQYLDCINKSAKGAAETIRRMRKFYRPNEETNLIRIDLNSIIQEAVSITEPRWKEEAKAAGKEIEIKTHLADNAMVKSNEAELNEVLTNLIFNAVDAMPNGGVIRIATMHGDSSVVLAFSDNGMGMSEETKNKCFDPFYTTKGAEGSGLGLATIQGIIQRHEGEMTVESTEGEGTTFRMTLPVAESSGETETQEDSRQVRPLQILVAEDEESQREMLSDLLTGEGHRVDVATDGVKALEQFNAGWYDLIITDRAMPDMGGDQLAKRVKKKAPGKPVVMLTGFGDMMDAAGEKSETVDAVLSKPVTKEKLFEVIGEVV